MQVPAGRGSTGRLQHSNTHTKDVQKLGGKQGNKGLSAVWMDLLQGNSLVPMTWRCLVHPGVPRSMETSGGMGHPKEAQGIFGGHCFLCSAFPVLLFSAKHLCLATAIDNLQIPLNTICSLQQHPNGKPDFFDTTW